VGYLRSGVTATLADQLGSAVFFCSGLPSSGVSIEISVSFVDAAAVGVRLRPTLSRFTFPVVVDYGIKRIVHEDRDL
jgi:acyl-coenzyme A thioesterase PaaI-like protein